MYSWQKEELANIRMSFSAADMGTSGISSKQLSAECRLTKTQKTILPQTIQAGTAVSLTAGTYTIPPFILGSYEIENGIMRITAFDKTADGDITFTDDSGYYEQYETVGGKVKYDKDGSPVIKYYHGTDVLSDACSRIGLGAPAVQGLPDLSRSEFVGKSVRSILTDFSKCAAGVFSCDSDSLRLAPFQNPQGSMSAEDEDHSVIKYLGNRQITKLYVTDGTNNITHVYGSGQWYNAYSTESPYLIGETICENTAGKIVGRTYTGWRCENVIIDGVLPSVGYLFNGDHIILDGEIRFGALSITASIGAPAVQQSAADFENEEKRAIDGKISANEKYGYCFIDQNSGFNIYYETEDVP